MEFKYKDYFSFESIRDQNDNVVCYHVTMIGTIEEQARVMDEHIAFGKLTLHNLDRKIQTFLDLTNSRTYYHDRTYLEGAVNVIRFAAHGRHIDEVVGFDIGDRVLIEGRAYLRESQNGNKQEFTVSVASTFRLGRVKQVYNRTNLVPQKGIEDEQEEEI